MAVNLYNSVYVYSTDTERELEIVRENSVEAGAFTAEICTHWAHGGAGAMRLAEAVIAASKQPSNFQFLYNLDVCASTCILKYAVLSVLN